MNKKETIIFILELPKVRKYVLHQQDIDPMSMQTVIELTFMHFMEIQRQI